jgi:ATP-dependent protease Clp ATPase subunit
MYDVPSSENIVKIKIDKDMVRKMKKPEITYSEEEKSA